MPGITLAIAFVFQPLLAVGRLRAMFAGLWLDAIFVAEAFWLPIPILGSIVVVLLMLTLQRYYVNCVWEDGARFQQRRGRHVS